MRLSEFGLARVQVAPGASCERLAEVVWAAANPIISQPRRDGAGAEVECIEHGAKSATYRSPDAVLRGLCAEVLSQLPEVG